MILNYTFLREHARSSRMDSFSEQNQVLNENRNIRIQKSSYDLFLSHSYLDKDLVYALVNLFNNSGYSVYVDWMVDTQLDRSLITKSTAETLRRRMDTCGGLAYVATSNIVHSKWCPWELGYVDGRKNGRCAILPILREQSNSFKGQEYLSLYPYIDYDTYANTSLHEFWVIDPTDNSLYIPLKLWLAGNNPTKH